jgi:hypothetical protein
MKTAWCIAIFTVAALLGACGGRGEDEQPLPELTPFPDELAQRLHEIRDKVAKVRGLPVNEEIEEGTLSSETLQAEGDEAFSELAEEDQADIDASEIALRMLGLIPPDYELDDYVSDTTGQIAGFYAFQEKALALVAEEVQELTVTDELVLAHEYAHSIQDGAFDLQALTEQWAETDLEEDGYAQYSVTLDCLIEGDATFTSRQYAEAVYGPDWATKIEDEEAAGGSIGEAEEEAMPEFLQRDIGFNYGDCAGFVEGLFAEGGWDAVNTAFERPPATTEQVLHLDKYHDREIANADAPEDLSEQLDGWREVGSAQFGEFDVFNLVMTRTQSADLAVPAAFGWGSGWSRVYRAEDNAEDVVFQLYLSFDSRDDQLEFLFVFTEILAGYGVDPNALQPGEIVRWTAAGEYGQFGAIILNDEFAEVEIRMATNEEALIKAVPGLERE